MKLVLLAQGTLYSDILIQQILKRKMEVKAIVVSKALLSGKSFLESIKAVIAVSGIKVFLYKTLDLIFFTKKIQAYKVPIYKSKNINSPQIIELLSRIKPDLIISCFFNQILKNGVLSIPEYGCINIHPSYLPGYRGVGVTFWVLANNEKETGVTVHYISAGIDSGDILAQSKISITPQDTMHSLYVKCAQEGARLIEKLLFGLEGKNIFAKKQNEAEATYFPIPTKESLMVFEKNSKKFFTVYELLKGSIFKLTGKFIDGKSYYLS